MKMQMIKTFDVIDNKQLEMISGGVAGIVIGAVSLAIAVNQGAYWLGQVQAEADYNRTHR